MRRFFAILLLCCLCIGSFYGCGETKDQSQSYFLMDTVITVTLFETSERVAEPIFDRCNEIMTELDALWARQKAQSDTARINTSTAKQAELDPRTVALIEKAIAVSETTNGAFDITVAPLVDLWQGCEEENRLPTDAELSVVLSNVGTKMISIEDGTVQKQNQNVQIDLGGIGKGAAIDILIDYLESCELQGGLVSFGSNVAVFGSKSDKTPFKIAIKDPKDPNGILGSLTLKSGEVLSVSGDYERYVTIDGNKYHHIFSPATGYPAETGLSSVVVVTSDGALADALSTALFVMGEADALRFYHSNIYEFEAVFVSSDGVIVTTPNLTGADFS